MRERHAGINDVPIREGKRLFRRPAPLTAAGGPPGADGTPFVTGGPDRQA